MQEKRTRGFKRSWMGKFFKEATMIVDVVGDGEAE